MIKFKLEDVWICELSYVYRRQPDNIMVLDESNSKHVLIMREHTCSNEEPKAYFDMEGKEYYHGTQKGVFREADIGKIFVVERDPVPTELLTEEEKKTQQMSAERIEELQKKLQEMSAEKAKEMRRRLQCDHC